mmetsp:Transcript_81005/g.216283  ORF Transcript_81005/g.216283 Transcript_81005/m.216283 type:complete len:83 (+) Transcript_81005:489-737(+)
MSWIWRPSEFGMPSGPSAHQCQRLSALPAVSLLARAAGHSPWVRGRWALRCLEDGCWSFSGCGRRVDSSRCPLANVTANDGW